MDLIRSKVIDHGLKLGGGGGCSRVERNWRLRHVGDLYVQPGFGLEFGRSGRTRRKRDAAVPKNH